MKIELGTVRESPFVGIFAVATDSFVLVPGSVSKKEERKIAAGLGVDLVKGSIANSPLLGVLSAGNKKGIVVGGILEGDEKDNLKGAGVNVKVLDNMSAVGNLLTVNDRKGICSSAFSAKQVSGIESFLGVKLQKATVAGTDIVGSCTVATNKGFVLNKMASEKEAAAIEQHFGVEGATASANQGDCFVGNSVIANSNGAVAGSLTSGFELARLDEGLRG